jgi:glucose/arabinose dehydrogenase
MMGLIRSSLRLGLLALIFSGSASPALAAEEETPVTRHVIPTLSGEVLAQRVISGLSSISAIEFLPDGKALLLQRDKGLMSLVDFATGDVTDIEGMQNMLVFSDAGTHDIELHPQFAENGWIYVSYSEGVEYHSTAVLDRVKLDGIRVTERERVFTADAYGETAYHFGARIQFADDFLFFSIGDRQHPERAQEVDNHAGTIVRLHDDGRVPEDNPFVEVNDDSRTVHKPEIWSYGHRNQQGLYRHPETGELWSNEHGPRGGDELNRVKKGANYGWPVISYGLQYDGGPVGKGITHQEGMEIPAWTYVPSIAPSDMVIYQGDAFPAWNGDFFIGALAGMHLNRLVMRDGEVIAEERIAPRILGRIRAIAEDSKGLLYLGNDDGEVWRLSPPSAD